MLCVFIQGQGFEKKDILLPELGDRVSGAVSSDQEKAIGNEFLKQIFAQARTISDPLIYEYTELLIYRLSEYSQVQDRYFNIILIDDSNLNAFAAPGGIIGVNGGLFLNADNEGQFASVLSHELAHLSQRHFARNILKSQDSNLASALLLVSSIAVAILSNNPEAIAVAPALLQSESLRYSRLFEREADRVGFTNLIKAGYNPKSMGEMFENMNETSTTMLSMKFTAQTWLNWLTAKSSGARMEKCSSRKVGNPPNCHNSSKENEQRLLLSGPKGV